MSLWAAWTWGRWFAQRFIDAGCSVGMSEVGLESTMIIEASDQENLYLCACGYNPLSNIPPTVRANGVEGFLDTKHIRVPVARA